MYFIALGVVLVIVFIIVLIAKSGEKIMIEQYNAMSIEELQAEYDKICKDIKACVDCKSWTTSDVVRSKIESDHDKYASKGIMIADILTARGVKVDYTKLYVKKWGNRTFY